MTDYSSQTMDGFYPGSALKVLLKRQLFMEAIFCPEEDFRVLKYFPKWGKGLEVFTIDTGSGDDMFIIFSEHGTMMKGFDQESPMSPHADDTPFEGWPGIYDTVPPKLLAILDEPAFNKTDVTFCIWQEPKDKSWNIGDIEFPFDGDDGSAYLLEYIHGDAAASKEWLDDYYEVKVDLPVLERLHNGEKPSMDLAKAFKSDEFEEDAVQEVLNALA